MASQRVLDPWRALVRLWVVGSAAWIAFWLWRDIAGCIVAGNGVLWCPNASGETLLATNYLREALGLLGPPLSLLLAGLIVLGFARRASRE
ncbi:MAG: hypothetical protein ACREFW_11000 [Rhizomicrobium sp.]